MHFYLQGAVKGKATAANKPKLVQAAKVRQFEAN